MLASKTVLKQYFCCSPAMPRSSKFPMEWSWRHIKIFASYFKALAVCSIHKRAFSAFKQCVENFNTMPELFLDNLLHFDIA